MDAATELAAGRVARVRPMGGSMRGRIESGQLVTLAPAPIVAELRVGDAVFVRWRGNYLLHLVKQIDGDRFLIGNNLGRTNGWVPASDVLGKVVSIEPEPRASGPAKA
jgi:hypothetical protein